MRTAQQCSRALKGSEHCGQSASSRRLEAAQRHRGLWALQGPKPSNAVGAKTALPGPSPKG